MDHVKISNSYYLDQEVVDWLKAQADKEERSASSYLNRVVRALMERKGR